MKVKEYMRRYLDRIVKAENTKDVIAVVSEITESLCLEANAEWKQTKDKSEKMSQQVKWRYNNKANLIAEEIERQAGRPILKKDWFRHVTTDAGESEKDVEREELKKEIDTWE